MTKLLMLACCLLSLLSCSTGYHAAGFLTGGYDDFKLAPDKYRIQFTGNEYTSEDRAYQYALRRSAEITKAQGFQYFKITNSSIIKTKSTYTTPVTQHTASSTDTYHYDHGKIKANETITTVSGGDVHESYSPSVSFSIKMYQHEVDGALNADVILSNFDDRR